MLPTLLPLMLHTFILRYMSHFRYIRFAAFAAAATIFRA